MAGENGDWRLTNQEGYLTGKTLIWRAYAAPRPDWDHDHCEFCWTKFAGNEVGDDVLTEGYVTTDGSQHWICAECFEDFRDRFAWTVSAADQ
jgi:hypothetical protein